jgi:hypothetical protein
MTEIVHPSLFQHLAGQELGGGVVTVLYRDGMMTLSPERPGGRAEPEGVVPGSLWITARSASVEGVHYEQLPPVRVVVLDCEVRAGAAWLLAAPFGIDEGVEDGSPDDVLLGAADSSLLTPLRVDVSHRLRLRAEQLGTSVGQIGEGVCESLRAAAAGDTSAGTRGNSVLGLDRRATTLARPDLAVLIVLQQPWLRATGRSRDRF